MDKADAIGAVLRGLGGARCGALFLRLLPYACCYPYVKYNYQRSAIFVLYISCSLHKTGHNPICRLGRPSKGVHKRGLPLEGRSLRLDDTLPFQHTL